MMIVQRPPLASPRSLHPGAAAAEAAHHSRAMGSFTVTFAPGPLGIALKPPPAKADDGAHVVVSDVVSGSAASMHNVPIGAPLIAVNGASTAGMSKATVLRQIEQHAQKPFALTFGGAPRIELGVSASPGTHGGVANRPLPPPPPPLAAAPSASYDPLDAARQLYAETHACDGKRYTQMHVLPCFV